MEKKEQIKELLDKYLSRKCTAKEIEHFLEIFNLPQNEECLKSSILQYFEEGLSIEQYDEASEINALRDVHSKVLERIDVDIKNSRKVRYLRWVKVSAAASIIMLFSLGAYFYFGMNRIQPSSVAKVVPNDVAPGGNKGILTLSDGTQIKLEKAKTGNIAQQGSATIKNSSGQLVYNAQSSKRGNVFYNKLTIPRGGQYQLTLPDGTKVWMNAASTIAFPTEFSGEERRVKVTGEVYFEVATVTKNENGNQAKMPFIVNVNDKAEVKVLGTHFNVSAYPEEGSIKTTLLEGSVQMLSLATRNSTLIIPGQQARLDVVGEMNVVDANIDEVMAWKNGFFYFNNANLKDVMQQLARWYDVKVDYEGAVPDRVFSGKIHRDINLSEALEILRFTKINFRIEGRCIIVTP